MDYHFVALANGLRIGTGRGGGKCGERGQSAVEFAIMYAGVILPLTFMTIFVSQALWIWHGVNEWTRDGARYAATNCFERRRIVITYMQTHVPPIVDQAQFQTGGTATVQVQYERAGVRRDACRTR